MSEQLKALAATLEAATPEAYDELRARYDASLINRAPHGTYYYQHAQCSGLPLGLPNADSLERNVLVIPDRYQAIRYAFEHATKRDSVLIAGKGHEDYQIFKDGTIHFSDREICCELLGLDVPKSMAPAHVSAEPAAPHQAAPHQADPKAAPHDDNQSGRKSERKSGSKE